jgi:hypothetical protein
MALTDEVEARFGEQWLVNATNPFEPTPTAVDSARLSAAAADAIGRFEAETRATFDLSNAAHVAAGVMGTACFLLRYTGVSSPLAESYCEAFETALGTIKRSSGSLAHAGPRTTSGLTVRPDPPTGTIKHPDFDVEGFDQALPRAPR